MISYEGQIERIKTKLLAAQKADSSFKVFGADKHKYIIHKPATIERVAEVEMKYSIELPLCYKSFLLNIGNGGVGYGNSAAGPYYGIYPLGESIDELIYDDTAIYLKGECLIYPKMTDEYWRSLNKNIDEDDEIPDDVFIKEIGKLWAGILPIGSQGCTYLHGIILNGKYKGRVVNLDSGGQKPIFAYEANFLDWYERWLDEVISGELMENGPSWFGYSKGGSEEELLQSFFSSTNTEDREDNLNALLNKDNPSVSTINHIEDSIESHKDCRVVLVQILCKSDYKRAKPHLLELVDVDFDNVIETIFLYAKHKGDEWASIIKERISQIEDVQAFEHAAYLLQDVNGNFAQIIIPFTRSTKDHIRLQAFKFLSQLTNKEEFLTCFIEGLKDKSAPVVNHILHSLYDVRDDRLLEAYNSLLNDFPFEESYILNNLKNRIGDYETEVKRATESNMEVKPTKKWYEIWK